MSRYGGIVAACFGLILLAPALPVSAQVTPLSPMEQLGKLLYFDERLSKNGNQSCATCHAPEVGFTGPSSAVNAHAAVYPGSDPMLSGNRRPPSAAYAGESPSLHYEPTLAAWVGGMFWDGRADGSALGDPLAEQAKGPFLNPLEMALTSAEELCAKVRAGAYAGLFDEVWGAGSLDCANAAVVYERIGRSIAAYERSDEVNPFSSKFDLFWDRARARRLDVSSISAYNWMQYQNLGLNDTELYGLAVFNDPRGGDCASCHSLKPGAKGYPLFTDYSYHNVGLPRNPENPFYGNLAHNPEGAAWVDTGIGEYLNKAQPERAGDGKGKMKVPTLRNVDKRPSPSVVKAYGHNGAFKSLSDIVEFYAMQGMMGGHRMGGGMMGRGGMGGRMRGGRMRGGHGMGGRMGRGGMHGGMGGAMMVSEPEVDENLTRLNMIHCRETWNIVVFLTTLSDGYFQR
jgi:cytochrome c peroxidase